MSVTEKIWLGMVVRCCSCFSCDSTVPTSTISFILRWLYMGGRIEDPSRGGVASTMTIA